jgi:DNA-binding winged helix-turn-helix (wHTH) protein
MHEPPAAATRIRFGPFTLDVRSGELRKGGKRLKVPDQSIVILGALLEEPGTSDRHAAYLPTTMRLESRAS